MACLRKRSLGRLLEENVVDAGLRGWIMPDFSTTTRDDRVVASVLMMGTLQKYFSYTFGIVCGIPSVKLLGTVEDWEKMLRRVEKLKGYGEELAIWCDLLTPILKRFVLIRELRRCWIFGSGSCIITTWALGLLISRVGSRRFVSGMRMEN